jgi:hypothetical protein
MPSRPPFARISITLPRALLRAADRLAARLGRSRSWVLAEALRRYTEAGEPAAAPPLAVHGTARVPYPGFRPGLGESRQAQLKADLALTPEERVKAAEETFRTTQHLRGPRRVQQLLFFDRFEDYLAWKQGEGMLA